MASDRLLIATRAPQVMDEADLGGDRLRIFFLASVVPQLPHATRAPNVVVNEAIRALRALNHEVVFQLLLEERGDALTHEGERQLRRLETEYGAVVLPPLLFDDCLGDTRRDQKRIARYYPTVAFASEIEARVRAQRADITFSLWSHGAFPAVALTRAAPNANYYGNLDYKPQEARLHDPDLFGMGWRERLIWLRSWWFMSRRRKLHFELMRAYDRVWNVCAVDVELQRAAGIAWSAYIPNMWPVPPERDVFATRDSLERVHPVKVCASIGGLQGTANTYGLRFLTEELAPSVMEKKGRDYLEFNVYGAREPAPRIVRGLTHPLIRRRGFVDDIDREIIESPVFLLCNNCGFYKAGHTRFLHAWTLGSCVIAHSGNAETMPELEHDRNVLFATSPEEFIHWIQEAVRSRDLRRRIGRGGLQTYHDCFTPDRVMAAVAKELRIAVRDARMRAA